MSRDLLLPHYLSVSEDGQIKGPVAGGPVTTVTPVALHQCPGSFLRGQAGPGDQERAAARIVHAFSCEVSQVAEFPARRQAKLQAGRYQPQPKKRPMIN